MAQSPGKQSGPKRSMILGVGLDSDGYKRITTGKNFSLIGGSKESHEMMVEKTVKINEKLTQRGKDLEEISSEEFAEIAHSVGLNRHCPENN